MSWESTVSYYRLMNEAVKARLGGLHSARLFLYSVDFHDIERLQHTGDWEAAGELLSGAACALESAGAELLVLGMCRAKRALLVPTLNGRSGATSLSL
jgi:aspartate racemase